MTREGGGRALRHRHTGSWFNPYCESCVAEGRTEDPTVMRAAANPEWILWAHERIRALEAELADVRKWLDATHANQQDLVMERNDAVAELAALRKEARVKELEAELANYKTDDANLRKFLSEADARAEKAEARVKELETELIKERSRYNWIPGPNHDCDVSGCSSVEHNPDAESGGVLIDYKAREEKLTALVARAMDLLGDDTSEWARDAAALLAAKAKLRGEDGG